MSAPLSGWRPRITGVLHAWVAVSFAISAFMPEGGDQIAANLALILVPVTLADPRDSHWRTVSVSGWRSEVGLTVAASAFFVARLQVAGIYLHAALGKMSVREWENGTALYYWFTKPAFGAPPWLHWITNPIADSALVLTVMTWGVIAFELLLFAGLVIEMRHRKPLLVAASAFHFSILLVHGLAAFFLSMAGALTLYLWPMGESVPTPSTLLNVMRSKMARALQPPYALRCRAFRLVARRPAIVPHCTPE